MLTRMKKNIFNYALLSYCNIKHHIIIRHRIHLYSVYSLHSPMLPYIFVLIIGIIFVEMQKCFSYFLLMVKKLNNCMIAAWAHIMDLVSYCTVKWSAV